MTKTGPKLPGRPALFRGKRRAPVSITLTPGHHRKIQRNLKRLPGCTRADFIGLLVEKYADVVRVETPTTKGFAYFRLRLAAEALGGSLEHLKRNEPQGGTWVLTLGDKTLRIPSEQSMRFPDLDKCYKLKPGVATSRTWADHTEEIGPAGIAALFAKLGLGQGAD